MAEPIEMLLGLWTWVGVQIPVREGAILRVKRGDPGHARTYPVFDTFKVTQQWAVPVQCGFGLGYTRSGAHYRHLANRTEPSVCGGNAAFCQITLTTRLLFC